MRAYSRSQGKIIDVPEGQSKPSVTSMQIPSVSDYIPSNQPDIAYQPSQPSFQPSTQAPVAPMAPPIAPQSPSAEEQVRSSPPKIQPGIKDFFSQEFLGNILESGKNAVMGIPALIKEGIKASPAGQLGQKIVGITQGKQATPEVDTLKTAGKMASGALEDVSDLIKNPVQHTYYDPVGTALWAAPVVGKAGKIIKGAERAGKAAEVAKVVETPATKVAKTFEQGAESIVPRTPEAQTLQNLFNVTKAESNALGIRPQTWENLANNGFLGKSKDGMLALSEGAIDSVSQVVNEAASKAKLVDVGTLADDAKNLIQVLPVEERYAKAAQFLVDKYLRRAEPGTATTQPGSLLNPVDALEAQRQFQRLKAVAKDPEAKLLYDSLADAIQEKLYDAVQNSPASLETLQVLKSPEYQTLLRKNGLNGLADTLASAQTLQEARTAISNFVQFKKMYYEDAAKGVKGNGIGTIALRGLGSIMGSAFGPMGAGVGYLAATGLEPMINTTIANLQPALTGKVFKAGQALSGAKDAAASLLPAVPGMALAGNALSEVPETPTETPTITTEPVDAMQDESVLSDQSMERTIPPAPTLVDPSKADEWYNQAIESVGNPSKEQLTIIQKKRDDFRQQIKDYNDYQKAKYDTEFNQYKETRGTPLNDLQRSMIRTGLRSLNDVEKQLGMVDVKGNPTNKIDLSVVKSAAISNGMLAPGFESAQEKIIMGILRPESGATLPPDEVARYKRAWFPQWYDTEESAKIKMEDMRARLSDFDVNAQEGQKKNMEQSSTVSRSLSILPTKAPITQSFGQKSKYDVFSKGVNYGVDFGVPSGTPITLPEGEYRVVETYAKSKNQGRIGNATNRGYGNSVLVEDVNTGEKLRFSHLSQVNVKPGETITGGQIGLSGRSGNASGDHLDLEYYKSNGQMADVMKSRYGQSLFPKQLSMR